MIVTRTYIPASAISAWARPSSSVLVRPSRSSTQCVHPVYGPHRVGDKRSDPSCVVNYLRQAIRRTDCEKLARRSLCIKEN